jgi:hypothetical protein
VPIEGYAPREHPLYSTWASMHYRCSNKNAVGYENYGGRGIKVCSRWAHFENFVVDMGAKPNDDFTIERIDNNRGYFKSNCRWATRTEQCCNRRMFSNNTSGYTGVVEIEGRYDARFDFERIRYRIGRFDTARKAALQRSKFLDLFFKDREAAIASISAPVVRYDSSTGVRGVTRTTDGGFIVRVTIDGTRRYLGYFKTLDEAIHARNRSAAG